jgi:hypothetical protein
MLLSKEALPLHKKVIEVKKRGKNVLNAEAVP